MLKPSLFIGSSTEGQEIARAVRSLLDQDAEITLWNEGFFNLGNTFIEALVNALPRFDFAVLILTPDDLVHSRDVESFGPRDNVIFELGLFMGNLGRSRTFVLHQSKAALKIPSDLSGVTTATYEWPRKDRNHVAAVGTACDYIRKAIRDLGPSERKLTRELSELRARQEYTETKIIETENKIENILAYSMSESLFRKLKKLSTGKYGRIENNSGFHSELRHLRNIGYITMSCSVSQLPKEGEDLADFVTVTPVGNQFIQFRESLEKAKSGAILPLNGRSRVGPTV